MLSVTAIVTMLAGAAGGITLWKGIGCGFSLAKKFGADKKLDSLVETIGEIHVSSKSSVFSDAFNVALNLHAIPLIKQQLVAKGLIDQFFAFMSSGPGKPELIGWFAAHGLSVASALEADLPSLAKDELGVLGHDLGGVLGNIVQMASDKLFGSTVAVQKMVAPATPKPLSAPQIEQGIQNLVKQPAPAGS
jgi:hypothetical protein